MSIKIENITTNKNSLKVSFGATGKDRTISLGRFEMAWSPNPRITNSLLIYQRKNLIKVTTEEKPAHLKYYTPYTRDMVAVPIVEKVEEKLEIHVQNVKGNIGETSKALEEALLPTEEGSFKGEISSEDFQQIVKEQKGNSILDNAIEMVDGYKGLNSGVWSSEDEKIIRKNYPKHGLKITAEKLNRSESSVRKKAESFGLKKNKKK